MCAFECYHSVSACHNRSLGFLRRCWPVFLLSCSGIDYTPFRRVTSLFFGKEKAVSEELPEVIFRYRFAGFELYNDRTVLGVQNGVRPASQSPSRRHAVGFHFERMELRSHALQPCLQVREMSTCLSFQILLGCRNPGPGKDLSKSYEAMAKRLIERSMAGAAFSSDLQEMVEQGVDQLPLGHPERLVRTHPKTYIDGLDAAH